MAGKLPATFGLPYEKTLLKAINQGNPEQILVPASPTCIRMKTRLRDRVYFIQNSAVQNVQQN
jgi:hypothetical protein